jgi:hypothetical protein
MIEPYIQKVGIKKGNLMDCKYISNAEMDGFAYLTNSERNKIMYRLKKQVDDYVVNI